MTRHRSVLLAGLALAAGLLSEAGAVAQTPTWVPVYPTHAGTREQLSASADGSALWGVVNNQDLIRSVDGGRTFIPGNIPQTPKVQPLPAFFGPSYGGASRYQLAAVSASEAYGNNGQSLSRTTDGGQTFTTVAVPPVTRTKFFEFAPEVKHQGRTLLYPRGGFEETIPGSGCYEPLPTTPVLVSQDSAASFRRIDIPSPRNQIWSVEIAPDERHLAALVVEYDYPANPAPCQLSAPSFTMGVWTSDDLGESWNRVGACEPRCHAVTWDGSDRLVAGQVDGRLLSSTSGAPLVESARVVPSVAEGVFLQDLDFFGDRAFASVHGDGIYVSDDRGATWTRELELPALDNPIGEIVALSEDRVVSAETHGVFTRMLRATLPVR